MAVVIPEADLPVELSINEAVETAYANELAAVHDALRRALPVMIECDKELTPYMYMAVRNRLRPDGVRCIYLDGRPQPDAAPGMMPQGIVGTMISQLRDAVRGAVERRVVVLPHLDLLTTSSGGLTTEAREVIPLMYENPEVLWLAFKDPSFEVPKVIANLFPHKESLLGIARDRLRFLVTQRESRKFGRGLNTYLLYKNASGMNAVRLRRMLSTLQGDDYPQNPKAAMQQIRQATIVGQLEIPDMDLDRDIGGYDKVKKRLKTEIIEVLAQKDAQNDETAIKRIESLIPRGMIFWGPPGTGKTLFAKSMASALGAVATVVSGPELKSKWVGESEENLRQVFLRARQSAPAVIVFDEIDSFASARGTYTGSGVEHSMVNQLLTEMDGFRKEELVFVVGTTNFVESIDSALLRPGRFEFHLHIPYPDADDRREILKVHDRRLELKMNEDALEAAVRRTGETVPGGKTRYSGDHIQALCRAIARFRLRDGRTDDTKPADVERALTEWREAPRLTKKEEFVVATHEAGHAICALMCEHSPPIEKISLVGDYAGALGFVRYGDKEHRYVTTRNELKDSMCILFGGREAEELMLDDLSIGSADDLRRATSIAHSLVEELGLVGGVRNFLAETRHGESAAEIRHLSQETLASLDREVCKLLDEQRERALKILRDNKKLLVALRDLLLEKKVLDRKSFDQLATAQGVVGKAPTPKEAK